MVKNRTVRESVCVCMCTARVHLSAEDCVLLSHQYHHVCVFAVYVQVCFVCVSSIISSETFGKLYISQ